MTLGTVAALVFWAIIALVVAYHTSQVAFLFMVLMVLMLAMPFILVFTIYFT